MSEQKNIPVPHLNEWLELLDEYVKPLDGISESDLSSFQIALSHAADPTTPLGITMRHLHECLQAYAAACARRKTSFVQPAWYRMYLGARSPLLVNYNYVLHSNVKYRCVDGLNVQAYAAAAAGHAMFYVRSLIDSGALWDVTKCKPPTAVDPTLSKDQYYRLFRTCRIPHRTVDGLARSNTFNVLVLRQGRAFVIPWMVRPKPSARPDLDDLAANVALLQDIMKFCVKRGHGNNILELSNGERDRWASVYRSLWGNQQTRHDLQLLSQCAFCICLDDLLDDDRTAELVGIPGTSPRCADINVSAIVNGKGTVALSMEHSWGDGSTLYCVTSAMCDVEDSLTETDALTVLTQVSKYSSSVNSGKYELFTSLSPTDVVHSEVTKAVAEHEHILRRVTLCVTKITNVGSTAIKSLKVSPDSFVHAALHLAQYNCFSDVRSTYASLMMKCYAQGRTETLRTVYRSTKDLVKAVGDASSPRPAMILVSKCHSDRITQCRSGKGVHRCLLVLRELLDILTGLSITPNAAELVNKELLRANAVKELGKDYLSTSAIATRGVEYFSFGPVIRNGFGVGYSLFPDSLHLAISAFADSQRRFTSEECHRSKDAAERFALAVSDAVSKLLVRDANL